MKKVLVQRKKPNIHIFPLPSVKTEKGDATPPHTLTFMPGVNELSQEQYKACCAHPDWAVMIEDEEMCVIDLGEAVKGKEDYALAGMSAKAAMKLVKDTVKGDMLEEWLSKETRGDVVKAINLQIEKLQLPPPLVDKEE